MNCGPALGLIGVAFGPSLIGSLGGIPRNTASDSLALTASPLVLASFHATLQCTYHWRRWYWTDWIVAVRIQSLVVAHRRNLESLPQPVVECHLQLQKVVLKSCILCPGPLTENLRGKMLNSSSRSVTSDWLTERLLTDAVSVKFTKITRSASTPDVWMNNNRVCVTNSAGFKDPEMANRKIILNSVT